MVADFKRKNFKNGQFWCDVVLRVFLLLVFVYVLHSNTLYSFKFNHYLLVNYMDFKEIRKK